MPVLWDKTRETIVSKESAEIIRMFNFSFNGLTGNYDDYYLEELRPDIDELNTWVYDTVNNGVYKSGFAISQEANDEAIHALFVSLDWLTDLLGQTR